MIRALYVGFALQLAAASAASAQVYTTVSGVVVFEAEGFSNNIARGVHAWNLTNAVTPYSGAGYMRVLPDIGSNMGVNVATTSPELQYGVQFGATIPHFVWIRSYVTDGNGDSCYAGLDGATNTRPDVAGVSNNWVWTNGNFGGGTASVTPSSAGVHSFSLWMREDGMSIDRIALTTNAAFKATIGNAWHIPSSVEPVTTMRSPLYDIESNTTVWIFSGNQFQGAGNTGDQLQTGSAVIHKSSTNGTWTVSAMLFNSQVANNKYYSNAIPAGTYQPGETVQYYLRIPYNDHLPTYLYGNDNLSQESEIETAAQGDPFSYDVQWPLTPAGGYIAITNASASGQIEARIYTNSGHLELVGPDLSGTPLANAIDFAPCEARFGGELHDVGRVLSWSSLTNGIQLVQKLGATSVTAQLTFKADGVMRYEVTDWSGLAIDDTYVTAPSDSSEHFYGFGEKFNSFDQAGKNVRMMTDDPPGAKGDQSYKIAPWFVSTRGYGFQLDSSAESYFDMRATAADRYVISNLFGTLKFNVVYGPQLTNVLSRYTGYSGRPALPPQWAFAPWYSSDYWHNGGEVRYVLTKYRERGIAGSVFVFDSPWASSYNDYTWNMTQFGTSGTYEGTNWGGFTSVNEFMSFFRSNGWKVICWTTPFINTNSFNEGTPVPGINLGKAPNYDAGAASNYYVRSSTGGPPLMISWWKGNGSPIDFTYPAAAQWLQSQLSNLVAQSSNAIGGFKTDDGESGNPPGSYIPSSAVYYDGRTGVEMANGYALEYHRTFGQVLGTNGILFARSGFAGSQAYPGYWAGDNEPNFTQDNGLKSVIVAGQSAAMSGYSIWGHDIGGYQDCGACVSSEGSTQTNLFMRWTEFGAFSPLMQMHRQVGAGMQYPWSFGGDALTNFASWTRLRMSLFPYLYTMAQQSSSNGLPILRPLVLLYQDDANVYGINHTFQCGSELLISAIVTNNATTRSAYLPAGTWYDFWTNRTYTGGQTIVWTNANQHQYPIFVRQGGIVPMISTNVDTLLPTTYMGHTNLVTQDGSLEFLVYPGTNSSFTVYDGTVLQCQSNSTVVTLNLTSEARVTTLKIFGGQPGGVERDGVRVPYVTNASAFATASLAWYFNGTENRTYVKFSHAGGASTITLGPDTVGDGLPNSWRGYYFGTPTSTDATTCATCDADGDGVRNIDEYRAGTNPNGSGSYLRVSQELVQPVASTNNVVVSWLGQPGIVYGIDWMNDLTNGAPWQNISSLYTGNGATINWNDNGSQTGSTPENSPTARRLYRVTVP